MMPSAISHEMLRTKEQETIDATRYAHHRAHTYRRPGPVLARILQAWMSKIPLPRHVRTARADLDVPDPFRLVVADLGSADPGSPPARRFRAAAPYSSDDRLIVVPQAEDLPGAPLIPPAPRKSFDEAGTGTPVPG